MKKDETTPICPQKRQLNLRVDSDIAACFQMYCRDTRMTQNLALNNLLRNAGIQDADNAFQHRFQMQEQRIRALQQEIKELRHTNAERQRLECERRRCWVNIMKQIVALITCTRGAEKMMSIQTLKPISYKRAKESLDMKKYQYPQENGYAVIYLDALVYGKGVGAPLFVLGHTENEMYLKLRWYPRDDFVGVSPKAKRYATKGSRWVVGYMISHDGAMDVFVALPLVALSIQTYEYMSPDLIPGYPCANMLTGENPQFAPGEFALDWSERDKHSEEEETTAQFKSTGTRSLDEMIAAIENR